MIMFKNYWQTMVKTFYSLIILKRFRDYCIPFDPDKISKILLVRNDNIGDVVCTIPCIRAVRDAYPDAFLAVLVCRLTEDIVSGNPCLDKVYVYDKAKHGRYKNPLTAWWNQYRVIREIQKERFDLAVGIRSCFSTSQGWLVYSSRAPFRLGHSPGKKNNGFAFFYNIYVNDEKRETHEVERSLDVLRTIDIDTEDKELVFFIPEDSKSIVKDFLDRNNLQNGKKLVGLHYSSRPEEGRWWDNENYLKLSQMIMDKGNIDLIFTSAPEDSFQVEKIRNSVEPKPVSFKSVKLKDFAALIKECDIFITLQGGAQHISAAVNTPTIAIFGKENPAIWAPWGEKNISIKRGNHANSVNVKDVLNAVEGLLGESDEQHEDN